MCKYLVWTDTEGEHRERVDNQEELETATTILTMQGIDFKTVEE